MKVTLAFLLCLVGLTMGAAVPSTDENVRRASVMENQPTDVMPIESGESVQQQPFEENEGMESSATSHKNYYYPNSYYYPHYYPRYYPQYRYHGYYPHY